MFPGRDIVVWFLRALGTEDTPRNCSNFWIGDSSDGRCDGILGRGIGRRDLYGTTRGIRSWNQGGRSLLQASEKHLWIETSTKDLEPENSAFSQINGL